MVVGIPELHQCHQKGSLPVSGWKLAQMPTTASLADKNLYIRTVYIMFSYNHLHISLLYQHSMFSSKAVTADIPQLIITLSADKLITTIVSSDQHQ